MAEYIEREKLWSEIQHTGFYDNRDRDTMEDFVISIPAEDVSPVVRGRWINDNAGVVCCSECGEEHEWEDYRASYCDTCGAKMKEANGND